MSESFSNGFIIWNCTGNEKFVSYATDPSNDKAIKLTLDGQLLKFAGSSTTPTVYKDVTFSSSSSTEQYKGTSLTDNPMQIASKHAIAVVPAENETLTISVDSAVSDTIYGHSINFNSTGTSITLDKTSILAIGAPDVKLTGNGLTTDSVSNKFELDAGLKYNNTGDATADATNPGTATLTLNSGSSITLTNSQLHIGSYQYGAGSLTIAENKSLALTNSALNIGAVNNATVESTVTVNTASEDPHTVAISGSTINVGGACGANGGGGGSSFALTRDAEFPRGTIKLYNDVYMETGISGEYSFQNNEYIIDHPTFVSGIWEGNGKVVITIIDPFYSMQQCTNNCVKQRFYLSILLYYVIISI